VLCLKLTGFHRVLIILTVALAAGVAHLFAPLLVDHILGVGVFAAILVLLLWLAQWVYSRFPQLRQQVAEKKRQAGAQKQQKKNGTRQESAVPGKEQKKQSKQDQE